MHTSPKQAQGTRQTTHARLYIPLQNIKAPSRHRTLLTQQVWLHNFAAIWLAYSYTQRS